MTTAIRETPGKAAHRRLPWGPMARLAGRRLLFAVPVLLVVTFGVFAIAAASPFDPVKAYAGTAGLTASQDNLDQLRANLGVDRPLATRWWDWLTSALTGDLGDSSTLRQPVADVIGERVGWSCCSPPPPSSSPSCSARPSASSPRAAPAAGSTAR